MTASQFSWAMPALSTGWTTSHRVKVALIWCKDMYQSHFDRFGYDARDLDVMVCCSEIIDLIESAIDEVSEALSGEQLESGYQGITAWMVSMRDALESRRSRAVSGGTLMFQTPLSEAIVRGRLEVVYKTILINLVKLATLRNAQVKRIPQLANDFAGAAFHAFNDQAFEAMETLKSDCCRAYAQAVENMKDQSVDEMCTTAHNFQTAAQIEWAAFIAKLFRHDVDLITKTFFAESS
ncbi:hypothetical protein K461DRAFT_296116 [Myriangium duriaei CBS 260.36]|uniref:Uncharacterized protein n=1 Tax=Myriangium duriaei CBS 260.36 TaxID=1168546 RepID=A0A9P4MIC9_9PEZI|nr:hypothetical protein K461DRAFT_296116 [Myriangium duriaei CBS 260.36]